MNLHVKTTPDAEGVTKLVELRPEHVVQPKRTREFHALDALVSYLESWAKAERCVLYYTPNKVVAVLDEVRDYDNATMGLAMSSASKRWIDALNKPMTHKAFKEFLEDRFEALENGSTFYSRIASLSMAVTVNYDAKLGDDQNYSIAFVKSDGGDVAKLPKQLTLTLPLVKGLEKLYQIPLKLKLTEPKDEKTPPMFELVCETLTEIREQVAEDVASQLREQLPGFLVVAGEP